MRDNYDFSNGIKNPYVDKLKDGYTVTVHYDFTKSDDVKGQTNKTDLHDDVRPRKQA